MKYDVVATIGTYEKDGQKKYINRNVGKIIDTKHGPKLLLERHFNPGGLSAGEDGMVWLALFEPKKKDPLDQRTDTSDVPFDDEITF